MSEHQGEVITKGERIGKYIKGNIFPLIAWAIIFSVGVSEGFDSQYFLLTWFFVAIPFGFRFIRFIIIDRSPDIGGSMARMAVPFLLGGVVGAPYLIWRLIKAVFCLAMLIPKLIAKA